MGEAARRGTREERVTSAILAKMHATTAVTVTEIDTSQEMSAVLAHMAEAPNRLAREMAEWEENGKVQGRFAPGKLTRSGPR